jgi:SAM-dependent methyltransferase
VKKKRSQLELSSIDWHEQFIRQAYWTSSIRQYILTDIEITKAKQILEVGCGTGAILQEFFRKYNSNNIKYHGLDISRAHLEFAHANNASLALTQGNAFSLPYENNYFDITFSHFFFLWIPNPIHALEEMKRVTKYGGNIIAFAEPDYGGRIDYPGALTELGELQEIGLQKKGAQTRIGRQLRMLFKQVGLKNIKGGILGSQWNTEISQENIEAEWKMLEVDMGYLMTESEFLKIKQLDINSWKNGSRVLFVPTFYAYGDKY